MKLAFYILIVLAVIIYLLLNYYIGLRGWQMLFLKQSIIGKRLYWCLFWILPASFFISRVTAMLPVGSLNFFLEMTGYYWMAASLYLLIIILICDFIRFSYRTIFKEKRRISYYKNLGILISIIVIVLVAALLIYGTWNTYNLKIVKYDVDIKKQAGNLESLNAVMVSDVHLGTLIGIKQVEKMVDNINKSEPDIVIIAGDLIDNDIKPLKDPQIIWALSRIRSMYGVYAVLGNHEIYSEDADVIKSLMEKAGIRLLIDECININDSFYIAGRNDSAIERFYKEERKNIKDLLNGIDITKPVIVIDHQPNSIDEAYSNGVDLLLSGHTHKGQIFPISLITDALFENDYGYLKKGNMSSIVSSGYGIWGPPLRIGSNSEILHLRIKFK